MSYEIAEHSEWAAERISPLSSTPSTDLKAEQAWARWRAERDVSADYEQLLRIAFHAGFHSGRYA